MFNNVRLYKITKYVFVLLHSMAHFLMKTAGDMSGISVNSLTELIFVDTCSIFIYAQSNQGQVLGSLSGMFETLYFRYINRVFQDNRDCIFPQRYPKALSRHQAAP